MKTVAILVAIITVIACGEKKPETTNEKLMPEGFQALAIGAHKDDVAKKVPLVSMPKFIASEPWLNMADKVYEEELSDSLYKGAKIGFKHGRVSRVVLRVRDDKCGGALFQEMVEELNKKLNCKAKIHEPHAILMTRVIPKDTQMAEFSECLPDRESDRDDVVSVYELWWSEKRGDCHMNLVIGMLFVEWGPKS